MAKLGVDFAIFQLCKRVQTPLPIKGVSAHLMVSDSRSPKGGRAWVTSAVGLLMAL